MAEQMPAGFEVLCKHLDAEELSYRRAAEAPIVFIAFQRPPGRVDAIVQWHAGDVMEWALVLPFLAPYERRAFVMEAIVAVNVLLHVGRIDYDVSKQRLVYRAFHVARDQPMTRDQVTFFASSALFVFDHLALPLQDVCLRGGDPLGPAAELKRVITANT